MKRLAEVIVPLGLRIACRRASCPTRRSPCSVNATTEGVVREPSALGMTVGSPLSIAAITELVVPRSMPTALAMPPSCQVGCLVADGYRVTPQPRPSPPRPISPPEAGPGGGRLVGRELLAHLAQGAAQHPRDVDLG